MQNALEREVRSGSEAGVAIEELRRAGGHVFFAVGSAGVAGNAVHQCDSSGGSCGLAVGYEHTNNGRCFQLRLNTTEAVNGQQWQWAHGAAERIDIIMQSVNTGARLGAEPNEPRMMRLRCAAPPQPPTPPVIGHGEPTMTGKIGIGACLAGLNNAFDLYMAQVGWWNDGTQSRAPPEQSPKQRPQAEPQAEPQSRAPMESPPRREPPKQSSPK